MKLRFGVAALLLLGFAFGAWAFSSQKESACQQAISITHGSEYRITVTDRSIKALHPQFFGFNLEWIGFQEDVWDSRTGAVRPEVTEALRAFPGAVYRYPGGTVANYFDWQASVGAQIQRPPRKAVGWRPPLAAQFGFREYLHFVKEVGGQPWLVANLYGDYEGERDVAVLAAAAGKWAAEARAATQSGAPPVLRWELGNELDRDRYRWPSEKYTARALNVAEAIRAADPAARFVGMLEDYDAQPPLSARNYNAATARALAALAPDYALHLYYDGKPGGPPIPQRLRHLCASADTVAETSGQSSAIWVTEHARWPHGRVDDPDWKKNWGETTNLEGALAVADMVIALSQTPKIEGAFLHSLAGTYGPWPLFHGTRSGLKPSAVYWALRVLREGMLDQVLETHTTSRGDSGYAGGYDLRASVLANAKRSKFALWAVNRYSNTISVKLVLTEMAGKTVAAHLATLGDPNVSANNIHDGQRLLPIRRPVAIAFDADGQGQVSLPANSVTLIAFDKQTSH